MKFILTLSITFLFANGIKASVTSATTDLSSCQDRCGEYYNSSLPCQCTDDCAKYGNCCDDFIGTCAANDSCGRRCGERYDSSNTCHCNSECSTYNNCCDDFSDVCIVSCEERCLEDDDPINSVCRCDASCSQYNNCCDDYDDVCGVGEENQYFCQGACNVNRTRCSCMEDCIENKNCCTDYQETCLNQTTWVEDECAPPEDMGCPADFDVAPVILFSIDGFRSEYLYRHLTPNIWKLASCGVHAPYMRSVFPTKTFPNHYTIATGLYPESHGIVDNTIYDHELEEEFRLGSPQSFNPAWWEGEPIWVSTSNQGKISACYFWPGSDVNITRYPDYYYKYDGSVDNEERMYKALDWLNLPKIERPSFITLYMDFVDGAGHSFGPESEEVNSALVEADNFIGMLMNGLKQLNLHNCVNLIILADHGMTPTSCDRKSSLEDYGVDLGLVYTRTGAFGRIGKSEDPTLWDQFNQEETHNQLRCTRNESHWLSYIKSQYLPKRYHYASNDRIEPVILDMDDEWLVEGRKNSNTNCNGGTHGFDNEYKSMHALFTAHGPGFKQQLNTSEPFENIEVYNLMADLLEINPAPNNGTPGSLYHLMMTPPNMNQPSFPEVKQCPLPNDQEVDSTCSTCWGISQDELNSRLSLTESEVKTSVEKHFPLGVASMEEGDYCHLPQFDYINVFDLNRNISKYVSFTLNKKEFDLEAPDGCLLGDVRMIQTATCGEYKEDESVRSVSLYPPELSNNDGIFDAAILSNQVPMYEPAKNVWNYTARVMSDWSARFNGIHVISGPIYDYNFDGLPDNDETLQETGKFLNNDLNSPPVPSHFFIIALRCLNVGTDIQSCINSPDDVEVLSFIIPNYEVEPCHTEKQIPFEWIPSTLKEHVARVRDIELITGISFFPNFYSADINSAIRFKLRLPQFTSEWLNDFVNEAPPSSTSVGGTAPGVVSLNTSLQLLITVFWAFVMSQF